jgi:hypothetical protein
MRWFHSLYYEVVLAKFPPTFLISAARDFSSSNSSHSSLRILLHAMESVRLNWAAWRSTNAPTITFDGANVHAT